MNPPSMRCAGATLAVVGAALLSALAAGPASAAPAAHWQILTQPSPTYFHGGDSDDFFEIVAVNDGGAPTIGAFTLKDTLPAGLTVVSAKGASGVKGKVQYGESKAMTCTVSGGSPQEVECTGSEPVPIGDLVGAKIVVEVPVGIPGPLPNSASVAGGGASTRASTTTSTPITAGSPPVPYGVHLNAEAVAEDGTLATQAGSHPFSFSTILAANVARIESAESCGPPNAQSLSTPGCGVLVAASRDVEVELPPGLVGDALNLPRCPQLLFQSGVTNEACPADTQVGAGYLAFFGAATAAQYAPIYNIEPPPGQPAEFGFIVGGGQARVPMFFHVRAKKGDYGLTAKFNEITAFDTIRLAELSFWGVPAAPAHDEKRRSSGTCEGNGKELGCPAGVPEKPLLSMPTSCLASLLSMPMRSDSWLAPGAFVGSEPEPTIAGMTGCQSVPFEPGLQLQPGSHIADSPTPLHVDLHVPQPQTVGGLSEANLRDATVTLPTGLTVNPSSANGLAGCLPGQIDLHGEGAPSCPNAAKLGTVEVDTPLLDHPLPGTIYLATPYENPFGSLLAIYLAINDPISGVVVKLAGQVEVGANGQLTTTFTQNPQLPFEDFKLDFFGGEGAALKTPATCGEYRTTSLLTPWSAPGSGPPANPGDSFTIDTSPQPGSCATKAADQPDNPSFEAGTESPLAGTFSPFVMRLSRADGAQNFSALTVSPPPGLVGRLAGVPYCPDGVLAAAANESGAEERSAPSCPSASQVGTLIVGAGAGPKPYHVEGDAYLAGPYKGAPLSLAFVTPAVAGPFDLGDVVVRAAIEVDPTTAQITVKSDNLPTELKNIPLDIRSIAVKIARQDFTLNPTNCEVQKVDGALSTTAGGHAALTNRFQVGGCAGLRFKPGLKLSLSGATGRIGHPGLKAVVTYPKAPYANIARAQVNLPHSEFLDQGNLNKTCTKPVLLEGKCPASTVYGHARAFTPLLDHPLEGDVYLVGGYGFKLPALVAELNGQIKVLLVGKVDSGPNKGIRSTFEAVPDAPVSRVELTMKGGKKFGLLENSENLCAGPQRGIARFTGQNGKVETIRPKVANECKKHAG